MTNLADLLMPSHPPDARAIWEAGRWFSYGELATRARQFAALVGAIPTRGDRPIVVLASDNSFHLAAAYLGVIYAGAIAAPLPSLPDAALSAILAETSPGLVLADAAHVEQLQRVTTQSVLPLDLPLDDDAHSATSLDPDALALLLYTSGSTGRPRGVMLSSNNLGFSAHQILACLPLTSRDRALVTLPFHYTYGLSVLHTHLHRGGSLVLANRTFIDDIMGLMADLGVTGLPVVPSTLNMLVGRGGLQTRPLPSLRYVMCSGSKLAEPIARELLNIVPQASLHVRYGTTESTAAASFLAPDRLRDKMGSIGRGLPSAGLSVERDDGSPIEPGSDEEGGIVIRGAHVALGYFRDEDANARSFKDGAFHTGDVARVDAEGFVFIVGRAKQFVKTGGHRVAPQQVEDVVLRMPEVEEAAVFAIPDPIRGEALVAAVVARKGVVLRADLLRAFCIAALPVFMVPVRFIILADLPRGSSGKLDRVQLVQLALSPASKPGRSAS
ncbi:MAG: AMP-binding protein [Deltaproteobacteria bacterium]|nr:AMP-binding protein [Deltaproteobacteria bacterium]